MIIPFYLQKKLASFGISSAGDFAKFDYREVFAWIREQYPSTGYKTLYDLYCVAKDLPINSLDKAKQKQYIIYLQGKVLVKTSGGESRVFKSGDILLANDLSGQGHITTTLTKGRSLIVTKT